MNRHRFPALIPGVLIAFVASLALAAGPATRPAAPTTRPSTRSAAPQTRPGAELVEKKVAQLTRKSLELLEAHKLDDAEPVLLQAIQLDPLSTVNLYNLACVQALKGRADKAMDYLEKAADSGYTDFTHLSIDSDLASLRDLPRYRDLVARKSVYQRRAADKALAALKKQFGDSYLYELDEPDKLIFATNVDKETLDALKQDLAAQARSQWAQLFEHKPDEFIRVVVPSPADYKKLIKMPGVGGIYNDANKILIARQLGQVMTHEFTHALHAADRAPLDQEHPIWLAEGLASMFEAAQWEGPKRDVLVPHDNYRVTYLQNAARGNKLIPLEKLLQMEQPEFVAKANLAYGQSSSLLLYLYEQHQLKPFYDAYKKDYAQDASGKLTLEKVTGKSLPELEKAWIAWMRKRTPPPTSTGPDGAFLGAQMGGPSAEAVDGVRITAVLPNGPAGRAGLRVGDVLVKIAGEEVRDFQSYAPLMSLHQPGETVVLRVRRGNQYLDLPVLLAKRSDMIREPAEPKIEPPKAASAGKPTTRPATRPAR